MAVLTRVEESVVYLIRARRLEGEKVWILVSIHNVLTGRPSETCEALLDRWRTQVGSIKSLTRFRGVHRWSEACMTIVSIQHPKEKVT